MFVTGYFTCNLRYVQLDVGRFRLKAIKISSSTAEQFFLKCDALMKIS